jgi:hypothetical protein
MTSTCITTTNSNTANYMNVDVVRGAPWVYWTRAKATTQTNQNRNISFHSNRKANPTLKHVAILTIRHSTVHYMLGQYSVERSYDTEFLSTHILQALHKAMEPTLQQKQMSNL